MSYLSIPGLGGFFDDAAKSFSAGWGPFSSLTAREERKGKKELAKIRLKEDAQTFEQQRVLTRDQAEAEAIENLRLQVVAKLRQMELEADATTGVIMQIRQAAAEPILKGDEIQEELAGVLADMEKAVIQVQAGTVVDTATFDTDALAGAYADASAGLVAMRAITARAQSVLKTLKKRAKDLKDEQIRLQYAQAAAVERAAAQEREQRQLAEQRQRELEWQAEQSRMRSRRDLMSRILEADRELVREKRRLANLKVELANLKFEKGLAGGRW